MGKKKSGKGGQKAGPTHFGGGSSSGGQKEALTKVNNAPQAPPGKSGGKKVLMSDAQLAQMNKPKQGSIQGPFIRPAGSVIDQNIEGATKFTSPPETKFGKALKTAVNIAPMLIPFGGEEVAASKVISSAARARRLRQLQASTSAFEVAPEVGSAAAGSGSLSGFREGLMKEIMGENPGAKAALNNLATKDLAGLAEGRPGATSIKDVEKFFENIANANPPEVGKLGNLAQTRLVITKEGLGLSIMRNAKNMVLTKEFLLKLGLTLGAVSLVSNGVGTWLAGKYGGAEAPEPAEYWMKMAYATNNETIIMEMDKALHEITDPDKLTALEKAPIVGGYFRKLKGTNNPNLIGGIDMVTADKLAKIRDPSLTEDSIFAANQAKHIEDQKALSNYMTANSKELADYKEESSKRITVGIEESGMRVIKAKKALYEAKGSYAARAKEDNTEQWIEYLKLKAKLLSTSRSHLNFGLLR